jgi:hypothetical protein
MKSVVYRGTLKLKLRLAGDSTGCRYSTKQLHVSEAVISRLSILELSVSGETQLGQGRHARPGWFDRD